MPLPALKWSPADKLEASRNDPGSFGLEQVADQKKGAVSQNGRARISL